MIWILRETDRRDRKTFVSVWETVRPTLGLHIAHPMPKMAQFDWFWAWPAKIRWQGLQGFNPPNHGEPRDHALPLSGSPPFLDRFLLQGVPPSTIALHNDTRTDYSHEQDFVNSLLQAQAPPKCTKLACASLGWRHGSRKWEGCRLGGESSCTAVFCTLKRKSAVSKDAPNHARTARDRSPRVAWHPCRCISDGVTMRVIGWGRPQRQLIWSLPGEGRSFFFLF